MAAAEMQKAIARLRLVLAAIKGKEEELGGLSAQFRRQLRRAPGTAIHGSSSLDVTLGMMREIQERLNHVEETRTHLSAIKDRAQDELQALDLTEKIERAKTRLASLKEGGGPSDPDAEGRREEIESLERFIQEASIRAGEAIADRADDSADR